VCALLGNALLPNYPSVGDRRVNHVAE
jgi:hypothetical protein